MFEIRLSFGDEDLDALSIRCINFKRETGLDPETSINWVYDESSIGYRAIPNDATVKELKSLGATFNFIDIWLKLLRKHYCAQSESYSIAMEKMFKQIPQFFEIH